jgi:hypothetical protein
VVKALRKAGCLVRSTAAIGGGFPDLVVCREYDLLFMLEVKDGDKPPSHRLLTAAQFAFVEEGWPVHVVTSPEEALRAVGL